MHQPQKFAMSTRVYNKATFAKETAKNKRKATATKMFQFNENMLS